MQREIKKFLLDIKLSIDSIGEYLGHELNFEKYKSSKLLRRGIERELEIIGEATNKLLAIDPSIEISNARRIVDLRNWVIHSYDNVDELIIWGIINKDLPLLKAEVEKLLNR